MSDCKAQNDSWIVLTYRETSVSYNFIIRIQISANH